MTTVERAPRGRAAATVERVLPWRRQSPVSSDALAPLLAAYRERHPKGDASLILSAYETAERAHEGQVRRSGEAYISHPVAVATVLAGLGMDDVTLAAALLHDAVEDTAVSLPELEASFGPAVAQIVDGVTKLERVSFDTRQAAQAATMRKMLVAMAKDPRVLLIKLGDRLHNMRTVAAMPEANQKRTAQETLDIYAPLAHRFGIASIKWQLEDLRSQPCTRDGTPRSNKWWPPGRPSATFTSLRSKRRSKSAWWRPGSKRTSRGAPSTFTRYTRKWC